MQFREIIEKKRNGVRNSESELKFLIESYLSGETQDYQISAWLMAVYFKGLDETETATLTRLMWQSGMTLPRPSRQDYWIDKHSVGGVGDKTSLLLVPIVREASISLYGAGAVKIPMVSGRGLGHSGGTLDKLDSVPGFSSHYPIQRLMELLNQNGFFMAGQTDEIAPADRAIYALRDVTATVDCVPLIVSSILSKKLSENLDGLVIDLKWGEGAFMSEKERSRELGTHLVKVAKANHVDTVAVMTNMDQPLGFAVGNLLEVMECRDFLKGSRRATGLQEVTMELATWMVHLAGKRTVTIGECRSACLSILETEKPLHTFQKMFEVQGGNWSGFLKRIEQLPKECELTKFIAPRDGILSKIHARKIGYLLNGLGGGRNQREDRVDSFVGFEFTKEVGETVKKGETIMSVFHRKGKGVSNTALNECVVISDMGQNPKWLGEVIQ